MKIFATKYTKISPEELGNLMNSDPSQITPVLMEAVRRGNPEIITWASEYTYLSVEHINIILGFLMQYAGKKITPVVTELVFYNTLYRPESVIKGVKPEYLLALMSSNPKLSAIGLLSEGLTREMVERLNNMYILNDPKSVPYPSGLNMLQNKNFATTILIGMIDLMREEYIEWKNQNSGFIFFPRLHRDSSDTFLTEASKYNINIGMARGLINASKMKNIGQGKKLATNLSANHNSSVEAAVMIESEISGSNVGLIIPKLYSLMGKGEIGTAEIWETIKGRHRENRWNLFEILSSTGQNILLGLFRSGTEIAKDILTAIGSSSEQANTFVRQHTNNIAPLEEMIHEALSNPMLQDHVLKSFNKQFFNALPMSEKNRQIVEKHFNPDAFLPLDDTPTDDSSLKGLFS